MAESLAAKGKTKFFTFRKRVGLCAFFKTFKIPFKKFEKKLIKKRDTIFCNCQIPLPLPSQNKGVSSFKCFTSHFSSAGRATDL